MILYREEKKCGGDVGMILNQNWKEKKNQYVVLLVIRVNHKLHFKNWVKNWVRGAVWHQEFYGLDMMRLDSVSYWRPSPYKERNNR